MWVCTVSDGNWIEDASLNPVTERRNILESTDKGKAHSIQIPPQKQVFLPEKQPKGNVISEQCLNNSE